MSRPQCWQPYRGESEAHARQRLREEQKTAFVDNLGLPRRHLELLRKGQLLDTEALQAIQNAVAAVVVLAGATGVGKTLAAVWWLFAWAMADENWPSPLYASPLSIDELKFAGGQAVFLSAAELARMDRYDDEYADRVLRPARLVLDDLGVEVLDERGFTLSKIDELVNARYCGGGQTLITTNMGVGTFEKRYGARVLDRLREAGQWFDLGGPSLRRGAR